MGNLNIVNNFAPGDTTNVINNTSTQQLQLAAEVFAIATIAAVMANRFMQQAQGGVPGSTGASPSPINPTPFMPIAPPPPPQGMTTDPSTGTISLPDGTTITQDGQYDWSVHNPDGTTSTITGDPHVNDGVGHKWDFQQDSTFVLKDGARINVNTVPYGNAGAHVTSSLEVLYGNQRATVTGIDKGKGTVSGVTNDGYQHVNDMPQGAPVFVEDSKDSWTLNGQEITGGSTLSGLQLGQNMGTLTNGTGNGQQWAQILFATLETALLASFAQQIAQGFTQNSPYQNYQSPTPSYTQNPQLQNVGSAFADLGKLLQAIKSYSQLTQAQGKPVFA
jgi:hypothetical protein